MTKRITILLSVAVALSACQREEPAEPLRLTGKMFVFNYRLARATYLLTLEKNVPLPEGSVVEATFENPAGAEPLVRREKVFANSPRVVLESDPVLCVKKDRPYHIAVAVIGPAGDKLQAIETDIRSNVDGDVLPAKPLVVGAGYEKNPEVFKDGETPTQFETAPCPAK